MYCTVKEIIRDVLDTDVPDSECVFAVVLTRGDVRKSPPFSCRSPDRAQRTSPPAPLYPAMQGMALWFFSYVAAVSCAGCAVPPS
ncbi:Uncharacterised protein [Shigella sonnei]|nr:Uncharacterised protein [Shigella sonnei]